MKQRRRPETLRMKIKGSISYSFLCLNHHSTRNGGTILFKIENLLVAIGLCTMQKQNGKDFL